MSLANKIKELQEDAEELRSLGEQAKRQKVRDIITVATRKLETELSSLREELIKEEDRLKDRVAKEAQAPAGVKKIPEVEIKNYSWDQTDKFVKIYLTGLTGLDQLANEAIRTEYTDSSLTVRIENLQGKTLIFNIKKTCHKIAPDKSYHKVKPDYLLIFMAKHNPGSSWSHMTAAEKALADSKKASNTPKFDDKEDPSAGLMNMMKKLYDDGDDEMKRTIAKAWTESRDKTGGGGLPDMGGF